MIHKQLIWILDNTSDMFTVLNIALTTISIITKMWHLLDNTVRVIFLSLNKISFIFKFIGFLVDVSVFVSKLAQHIYLLAHICVVRIYKHELIVVCYVIVLISFKVFLLDVELYSLFLDNELCIFMIVKGKPIVIILFRTFRFDEVFHLAFCIA